MRLALQYLGACPRRFFIAAPAVLTNASSVLALGTSNRFARAIDRARQLARQVTQNAVDNEPEAYASAVRQFDRAQLRGILLLRALKCFYSALGAFAASALVSLVGAGLSVSTHHWLYKSAVGVGLVCGFYGVSALVWGCSLLIRDTQLAVVNLSEEGDLVKQRIKRAKARTRGTKEEHQGAEGEQ